MKRRKKILCCLCGLFNNNCRVLPAIPDELNEIDSVTGLINIQKNIASRKIQQIGMTYIIKKREDCTLKDINARRVTAATNYYFKTVLKSIWQKIEKKIEEENEILECQEMIKEEKMKKKIDFEIKDRKSTRLNSSHLTASRMPSSA